MTDRTSPEQSAWQWPVPTAGSQFQQTAATPQMTNGAYAVPQAQQVPAPFPPPQRVPGDTASRLPYSYAKRAGYGLLWAAWTVVLTIGGFAELFGGQVFGGLVALVLGALAGRYDYRIWTWQARRLLFLIIW